MIMVFVVFFLLIVYVNRRDHFGENDVLFYLNIFEINLAAILMRFTGKLASNFFEEEYYQVKE